MINENNEIIITTAEGVQILNVINKLQMKEDLGDAIAKFTSIEASKTKVFTRLRELMIDKMGLEEYNSLISDEERSKASEIVLEENREFKKEFNETMIKANMESTKLGMELTYTFASKIPNAEKIVYKCLAKIVGKTEKEIENQGLDETINIITAIAKSKTVLGFMQLLNK